MDGRRDEGNGTAFSSTSTASIRTNSQRQLSDNMAARPATAPLRFAMLGTGFWSRFQLAAWRQLEGVTCVALYDPVPGRAAAAAEAVSKHYASDLKAPTRAVAFTDLPSLLDCNPGLDFVDIVSPVETHRQLVEAVAARGIPVICQKPMAPSYARAKEVRVTVGC